MPQIIQVANLRQEIQQYMDPDGDQFNEEVEVFSNLIMTEISGIRPAPEHVVLWDDQEGGDPGLDLQYFNEEELLGAPMVWRRDGGSYYCASKYVRDWYPVGRFVLSLSYGGSPLNSAGGFYILVG